MSEYEDLLRRYYPIEETTLRKARERLEGAAASAERREALDAAVGALRAWFLESIQAQERRIGELETALREARSALASAQERMEGMERENQSAAAVLYRQQTSAGRAGALETQGLERRVESQERLLKEREAELMALRLKLDASRRELDGLLRRLEERERAAADASAAGAAPRECDEARLEAERCKAAAERSAELLARRDRELGELRASLDDAASERDAVRRKIDDFEAHWARSEAERMSRTADLAARESELESLRARARDLDAEAALLRERNEALSAEKAAREAVERDRSKGEGERLVEWERRIRERDASIEKLESKLAETQAFCDGFLQRIRALESERDRAAPPARVAPPAPEPAGWAAERAELTERLTVLQGQLANQRVAREVDERRWVETMTEQDMQRLKQLDLLKAEVERLRSQLAARRSASEPRVGKSPASTADGAASPLSE